MALVFAAGCLALLGIAAWMGVDRAHQWLAEEEAETAEAEKILIQRLKSMRHRRWTDVCRGDAVASWFQDETRSAVRLKTDDVVETVLVTAGRSIHDQNPVGPSFLIERSEGGVTVVREADLKDAAFLAIEASISWKGRSGPQKRTLRTITARFGSRLDAAEQTVPTQP
jgi:hypothetical protein